MKRMCAFFLVMFLFISSAMLQGCGKNGNVIGGGGKRVLKPSDLSIADFVWETVPAKHNGYDCYSFSLVNNSDYDIISVEFTYKVKDNVTDDELLVYDEFMKDHDGYIEKDDSPKDVILRGSKDTLVLKGEQLTGLRFAVGFKDWVWYDYPTEEQFRLMEPKELVIGVVGTNDVLYIAYYNFVNKTWVLDDETLAVDTWSKKEIAQKIGKPQEDHHIVLRDEENAFRVYSYGITAEEYSHYVSEIKNAGFEEEYASSAYFKGKDAEGFIVVLDYDESEERLYISLKKE